LVTKTKCDAFTIDILDGKVGGLKASAKDYDIKKAFPCFTSAEPEGSTAGCGGQVAYKDRDVYFFVDRDYIEIRDKVKATLTVPLMGGKRNSFFKFLGNPKLKDDKWDAFQMSYGTLILYYNSAGKVNKIQISTMSTDNIQLCQ
jgi:hypothetical protein